MHGYLFGVKDILKTTLQNKNKVRYMQQCFFWSYVDFIFTTFLDDFMYLFIFSFRLF